MLSCPGWQELFILLFIQAERNVNPGKDLLTTLQLLVRTIHQQLPYLITVVMELWFTIHFLEYIPQS